MLSAEKQFFFHFYTILTAKLLHDLNLINNGN